MVYRTLTDIKRVVKNQAVETLTQYRYDEHGQLTAVISRNGDTVRSFSYAEGLMVSYSNALGLGCHYRWETLAGKPWVVEHWTSDGVHLHFRYDLDACTSWATDVLGRELKVQYNPVNVWRHMVPHTLTTSLGITPFNSFNNVPSMFWLELVERNDIEHSSMHGYNDIGARTKPVITMNAFKSEGLTDEKGCSPLRHTTITQS